jgi:hypothetical protein
MAKKGGKRHSAEEIVQARAVFRLLRRSGSKARRWTPRFESHASASEASVHALAQTRPVALSVGRMALAGHRAVSRAAAAPGAGGSPPAHRQWQSLGIRRPIELRRHPRTHHGASWDYDNSLVRCRNRHRGPRGAPITFRTNRTSHHRRPVDAVASLWSDRRPTTHGRIFDHAPHAQTAPPRPPFRGV